MTEEPQKPAQPPRYETTAMTLDERRSVAEKLTRDLSYINARLSENKLVDSDLARWIGSNQVAAALAQMHVLLSIDERLAKLVELNAKVNIVRVDAP